MSSASRNTFWNRNFSEDRIRGGFWGAGLAAAALVVGGSYFPGWQLDSTADAAVLDGQRAVLVQALAPVCAERFRAQDNLPDQVAALKKVNSWSRDTYLVEQNLVIPTGISRAVDESVGDACANLLKDLVQ